MLHAAGALTLDISLALLEEGRGLKDATPGNVLFRGAQPVFIDVLSFEERDPLDSIWLPDAQFSRTFLIPLLLMRRTGAAPHECFLSRRDGVSPEEAAPRLSGWQRWLPLELGLVTMPAKAARLEKESLYRAHKAREAGEAQFILQHRLRGLRKKLDGLLVVSQPDIPLQVAVKREFVERALNETRPARVLDMRSGAGEFSVMAASAGASVVAIDPKPTNVDALWRTAAATKADILPLVVDIARPTPAVGWRSRENASFLERADGMFDCALFLGALHEVMVGDQVPLPEIFDLAASLTTKWLVMEYVGPEDALFRKVTRGRDELYRWYSRSAFEACAGRAFETVRAVDIPQSDRAIYLLRRRP